MTVQAREQHDKGAFRLILQVLSSIGRSRDSFPVIQKSAQGRIVATHQLDEGAVGVELLGHDVVVHVALRAGAGEDAVERSLVVLVQFDAHVVPVVQQLLRTHRRAEIHQTRACVLRLLQRSTSNSQQHISAGS